MPKHSRLCVKTGRSQRLLQAELVDKCQTVL
jgi:hypothetical protein